MYDRKVIKKVRSLLIEASDLLFSALHEREVEDYVAFAVLRLIKALHMLAKS